ncbi:5548_t:CDS:2 [Funneliformis geosporum]|nr:5548_t:CDS:2 [Funneliformis geosporum]
MTSKPNLPHIQKELYESSQKLRQELFDSSNGQLINVSRALTQTSDSLSKIQKSVEESRDNIKVIERDLRSLKNLIFKLDPSFVPNVINSSDQHIEAKYV